MPAAQSARTLVIGLESAELSLIEKWARDGSLRFVSSTITCPMVILHTAAACERGPLPILAR